MLILKKVFHFSKKYAILHISKKEEVLKMERTKDFDFNVTLLKYFWNNRDRNYINKLV